MENKKQEIENYLSQGKSRDEIASIYGVHRTTIGNWIKKWNIEILPKQKYSKLKLVCKKCGKEFSRSKYGEYCCASCAGKLDTITYHDATTELGRKIVEARKKGLSMHKIASKLNCSVSTVSYYCSKTGVSTSKQWKKQNEKLSNLVHKINTFKDKEYSKPIREQQKNWKTKVRTSTFHFKNKFDKSLSYTYKDVINHIGGTQTVCYLTGRKIDLQKDDYSLDHIIPVSRGGTNDLTNLGITCPIVNLSKNNLTVEEYLSLCKEILEYNGYKVEKIK